ncbi:UTP--glucose-1-phosphate uridylyltransferase GalU [Massilia sp. 2TAF26]|uniref:UTP--glucose-1-phosphate uridylyltransferase GalU n=1 Tax=Massilia sp. 2TAF26 TaxID=3233012 RepID=UPI003F9B7F75
MKIKKAVFPVAGLGSRFLPATKAQPKEMLPVVDKPLIQYAVEEAVAAGITEMIFITGRNKRAIEDHFDKAYELESELAAAQKHELLNLVQSVIPKNVSCIYIRQAAPLGLGHAVLCARPIVQNEPFAVLLADDFMDAAPGYKPVLAQMTDLYNYEKCSILAVQNVPRENTRQYGIVSTSAYRPDIEQVSGIVEKPHPADAPSTLAVVGRYVLSPHIFDHLEALDAGAGGEIQLTDGIAKLMAVDRVLAHRFAGQRYDCGSKLGYLKAMTAMGLRHPETGAAYRLFLDEIGASSGII